MTNELLELLAAMKVHAERERNAIRHLNARHLFDLASEGEQLARRLSQLLAKVTAKETGSKQWGEICVRAGEVRAIARTNAELMRRSLDVIRASRTEKGTGYFSDADGRTDGRGTKSSLSPFPSFISRVA